MLALHHDRLMDVPNIHGMLQVMFSNWPTTYGEVVVRAPQRAYQWHSSGIVSDAVSYVVSPCPSLPCRAPFSGVLNRDCRRFLEDFGTMHLHLTVCTTWSQLSRGQRHAFYVKKCEPHIMCGSMMAAHAVF